MPKPLPHSGSDQRGRVLIIYASKQDRARVVANAIAARIRVHGIVAEVGDASCGMMPPPQDYDAVVLGVPARFGHSTRQIASYIDQHREALSEVPAALFTVGTSGAAGDPDPGRFLAQFVRATRWRPDLAAAFADGEPLVGDRFADRIATELARAAVGAERTEPHLAGG